MRTNLANKPPVSPDRRSGFLMVDLAVAISLLAIAILPLAYSFMQERDWLRAEYQRGVAMEIVDGEMEILAAGGWHHFTDGTQNYPVYAPAAANLPPGKFQLTKNGSHLRLEWTPDKRRLIGPVVREVNVK